MVVILLVGCQSSGQKAIQTICQEVGKTGSNCTKKMGLISASVVENQLLNHPQTKQESKQSASLLDVQDSFSW